MKGVRELGQEMGGKMRTPRAYVLAGGDGLLVMGCQCEREDRPAKATKR